MCKFTIRKILLFNILFTFFLKKKEYICRNVGSFANNLFQCNTIVRIYLLFNGILEALGTFHLMKPNYGPSECGTIKIAPFSKIMKTEQRL